MATPLPEIDYGGEWRHLIREMGLRTFRPLTRMSLIEWAEASRTWPDGTPYRTMLTPHVREPMEAYSDPGVEEITIVKPSQSGLTEGFAVNAVGYHIDQDPRPVLLVIPSVDEARKWSHKKLQPMIDNTPVVQGKLDDSSRASANTMVEKTFPGGSVGIIGSNSGRGFRMVTIGTAIGDDVEGWDHTAGKGENSEGGQVGLLRRRTDRMPDRKHVWISTPRMKGGRIHQLYEEMERRGAWHVPCPECGEMQPLVWGAPDEPFGLKWKSEKVDDGYQTKPGEVLKGDRVHRPETAYYVCRANGCEIEESAKVAMEAAGEYLADDGLPVRQPGVRTVGYWLRGALTITLPGSEWPRLIRQFLHAQGDPEELRAFRNLVLAEFWESRGEALEWERLYERRERYPIGVCPDGVEFLTAGVDVQDTWVEGYVWGWGWGKESWYVDHIVIDGPITRPEVRAQLTEFLHSSYPKEFGGDLPLAGLAIDTGHEQAAVVSWAQEVGDPRIMLVKGSSHHGWSTIIGSPTKVNVTYQGKRYGHMLWPVGTAVIKQETYGFFRLPVPLDDEPYPSGYAHLPMVDDEVCKQLVGEDLITMPNGRRVWEKNRARNEGLDCRVYARACAERNGLARMVGDKPAPKPAPKASADEDDGKWLGRGSPKGKSKGRRKGRWLDR